MKAAAFQNATAVDIAATLRDTGTAAAPGAQILVAVCHNGEWRVEWSAGSDLSLLGLAHRAVKSVSDLIDKRAVK